MTTRRFLPEDEQRTMTLVGPLPTTIRPPANLAPVSVLPLLPASSDALGDLVHNALQRPEDLVVLSCSEQHLVAVLERSQQIEDDRDRGREILRRTYAELEQTREHLAAALRERDMYRRAYEAERDAIAQAARAVDDQAEQLLSEQAYAHRLLVHNEHLRQETDRARRAAQGLRDQLADVLAELGRRDAAQLAAGFDRASRAIAGVPSAELARALEVPPADSSAFGDPGEDPELTRVWPRGTDPVNRVTEVDKHIVDVPLPGGAK